MTGYQRAFVSSPIDGVIEDIAINVKMSLTTGQDNQEIQKIFRHQRKGPNMETHALKHKK